MVDSAILMFYCDYDFMSKWLTHTVRLMWSWKIQQLAIKLDNRTCTKTVKSPLHCVISFLEYSVTKTLCRHCVKSIGNLMWQWYLGYRAGIIHDLVQQYLVEQYRIDCHGAVCYPRILRMVCRMLSGVVCIVCITIVVQSFASRGDKLIVCLHQLMTSGTKRLKVFYDRFILQISFKCLHISSIRTKKGNIGKWWIARPKEIDNH